MQRKWCSPADAKVMLVGEVVDNEMGFVVLQESNDSLLTSATLCAFALKLNTAKFNI